MDRRAAVLIAMALGLLGGCLKRKEFVRVRLPGEIIAHNADRIEDGEAVWEFSGEDLMDRDQVLMVTSRLRRGGRP